LVAERSEATHKSLTFPYWLPLLDAFRTVNWNKVREELKTLANIMPTLQVQTY